MLRLLSIFLVFLTTAHASAEAITIAIVPLPGSSEIKFFGKKEDKITENEAKELGLHPESACMKRVAKKFSQGQEPQNCYLEEPTPSKLYPSYGWSEVTSIYWVRSVTLIKKTEEWHILQELKERNSLNDLQAESTFLQETFEVSNTISHEVKGRAWMEGNSIVVYDGDESYVHKLGKTEERWYLKKLNTASNVTLVMPPRSWSYIRWKVKKKVVEYEITYENVLNGDVAVDFNPTYESHHFYAVKAQSLVEGTNQEYKEKLIVETYLDDIVTEIGDPPVVKSS